VTLQTVNPQSLGPAKGYSHGIVAPAGGRLLFVAGQTAAGPAGKPARGTFVEQWSRALEKVLAVVREAGGAPEHVARLTIYVTDLDAYFGSLKPLGEAYRRLMGRHYPAMALLEVKGLVDPNALVEIEAAAVLP
jgi:enamine deaminase RidA (YjgF/YER057c/UK114 family)